MDITKFNTTPKSKGQIDMIFYKKSGAVLTDTPFFLALTEGVENYCQHTGYSLNIKYVYDTENVQQKLEDFIYAGAVGFILLGTEMMVEDLRPFAFLDIPIILLDNHFRSTKMDCVQINNVDGAFTATNYLINKKRTQPGYLHSSYSITNFEERSDGFYKAIKYNGMSRSKSIVHTLTPSVEGAYEDMMSIIQNGEELASCYFADNDLIAAGAMKAFRACGYAIPQDIAVIGFDDMPLCTYVEPTLTTIHVPKKYMGKMAAERLISIIENKLFYPVNIQIGTNLIKRNSI
ncbi:MAG: substrate-binding domain-containing protein [Oliverpabstia sp.]